MNRLRVGVVGVGHLGQHHARIWATLPDVELVGVADSRPEQARAVAERCGTVAVADYRDLLGRVDAVSVAVPTRLHREVAAPFLDRGIAALVEKPLAPSVAEGEALVALARRRGAVLQVGHVERFNPALSALDGLRPRPWFVAAERSSTYTFRSTDIGVVLDLMIHDIDLLLSLVASPVRSVSAVGVCLFGGDEDVADARIEFEDGCVAHLTANRASRHAARAMRIWSAEGYASLDFAARRGTLIRPSEGLRRAALDLEGLDRSRPEAIQAHVFGKLLRVEPVEPAASSDPLTQELEDFARAVRTGSRPRVSGDDGLRALRLADRVVASLRAHQWDSRPDEAIPAPIAGLPAPMSWRYRSARRKPAT